MFDFDVRDRKPRMARSERTDPALVALTAAVGLVPRRGHSASSGSFAEALRTSTSIGEALQAMLRKGLNGLPVEDESGARLGTVSTEDIALWLRANMAANTAPVER